ncbi:MAG: hypothetical protein ACKVOG_12840 [Rhodoglobus sp.]
MAKERCYRTCLVYGRRWEPGEVREVEAFDAEGQPIATAHFRIVQAGDVEPSKEVFTPKQQADIEFAEMRGDRVYGIRKALESLDPEDNGNWTIKGQPSLQRVYAITGFELQRGDIVEAWPEFDRDLAKSLKKR